MLVLVQPCTCLQRWHVHPTGVFVLDRKNAAAGWAYFVVRTVVGRVLADKRVHGTAEFVGEPELLETRGGTAVEVVAAIKLVLQQLPAGKVRVLVAGSMRSVSYQIPITVQTLTRLLWHAQEQLRHLAALSFVELLMLKRAVNSDISARYAMAHGYFDVCTCLKASIWWACGMIIRWMGIHEVLLINGWTYIHRLPASCKPGHSVAASFSMHARPMSCALVTCRSFTLRHTSWHFGVRFGVGKPSEGVCRTRRA
jgi:hypothetical protein